MKPKARIKKDASFDKYRRAIAKTLESGVRPLTLKYRQVNEFSSGAPMAYRTSTYINSVVMGRLAPYEYRLATDTGETGIRRAEWSVTEAMRHITEMVKAGRKISWISVQCPARLAASVDMYRWMKRLIAQNKFEHPEMLCLEFSEDVLRTRQVAKVRLSILDMKLLGVKTMLTGGGNANCPLSRLATFPFDFVMLSPEMVRFAGSRNKPQMIPTLVAYISSMRAEVYADGISNDTERTALSRAECVGYTAARDYQGSAEIETRLLTFRAALAQKDEEGAV